MLSLVLLGMSTVSAIAADYRLSPPELPKHDLRGQATVFLGDFYFVGEEKFLLQRRVDELVVRFDDEADGGRSSAALTGPGGVLQGFVELRQFAPNLRKFRLEHEDRGNADLRVSLYRDLEARLGALASEAEVLWAAPVFVNETYQTYAVATDEIIVRLRPGVDADRFFANGRFASFRRGDSMDAYIVQVEVGAGEAVLAAAAALQGDARVLWAEPNFFQERMRMVGPNDPLFPLQWHLHNTGQTAGTVGADARLLEAWAIEPGGSTDLVIAVLDDGIELGHPDLRIFSNPDEVEDGIDSDGNGYIDDIRGWDFTSLNGGDNNPGASVNNDEHGTAVAGIAAARGDNAVGVSGAAFNASILPVRIFLGPTPTSDANIASALAYASGRGRTSSDENWRGADIVNNSWGGGAPSTAIRESLEWAAEFGRDGLGTPHFISAGNSGANSIAHPAVLSGTVDSVFAVGASSHTDRRSSYSQFGPQLDFVAPSSGEGVGTVTTDRLAALGYNGLPDLDYTNGFGGTSSASPLAAGVAGLILSRAPDLTLDQLRLLMRISADRIGPLPYVNGRNLEYGSGRINAYTALRVLDGPFIAVSGPDGSIGNGDTFPIEVFVRDEALVRIEVSTLALDDSIELGPVSISGDPSISIVEGFDTTLLEPGKVTSFVVRLAGNDPGSFSATASFTTNLAGTETFTIDFALDVLPLAIAGTVYEDWQNNEQLSPGDQPIEGVLVFLDLNDDGQIEPPPAFDYFDAVDLAFGSSPSSVSSTIEVEGLAAQLSDVEVLLNINHQWVGDVRVQLTSPDGLTRTLINQAGGGLNSGQNFTNTRLTDSAATSIQSITAAGAPYTGSFRPTEPFEAFAGSSTNGDWTLTVIDAFPAQDNGVFINWTLTLYAGCDPIAFSSSEGRYRFADLEPGAYVVRAVTPDDWVATEPAAGSQTVLVAGPQSNNPDVNFGFYRTDSIYGTVRSHADPEAPLAADATGLPGVVVFVDLDKNGEVAPTETTAVTSEPGLAIPDNNAVGVSDSVTLPDVPAEAAIEKVTVTLNITHTFVGDLQVFLTPPGGAEILLVNQRGGSGDDFTDTVLDDGAELPISGVVAGDAPFTGSFRPETPLSTLAGGLAAGDWVLRVADRAGLDVGTLDAWALTVTYQPEPLQVTDASGNYRFDAGNLPSGSLDLRALAEPPYLLSFPPDGVHQISNPEGDTLHQLDFGLFLPDLLFRDRFENGSN